MFPQHGPVDCRRCFENASQSVKFFDENQFRLLSPPAAYGAHNPVIAVLGMTYGSTQNAISTEFDEQKAFAGMRDRLDKLLRRVGIFRDSDHCNAKLRAEERDFHFGSVIRCSLMARDKEKEARQTKTAIDPYSGESSLVIPAFQDRKQASATLRNCADVHLRALPDRLRLVILLGNSDAYVSAIRRQLQRLYPFDYKRLGRKAHFAAGRNWVHLTHPSKGNYAFYDKYLDDPPTEPQGIAREEAIAIIQRTDWRRHLSEAALSA